ncbi:Proteasome Adapter And Scaffold Protein Ecm29 [Manis pentadactyla]|nr:Proteasome Adapter And Scaffold Protein Ecm29 [Manis pentadactyla]
MLWARPPGSGPCLLEVLSRATLKLCPGDRHPWLQSTLLNFKDEWAVLSRVHYLHRKATGTHTALLSHRQGAPRLPGKVGADPRDAGTVPTPRALSDLEIHLRQPSIQRPMSVLRSSIALLSTFENCCGEIMKQQSTEKAHHSS